uniref:Uncharacterized protein n=1 Tax=Ditylenchus dipsaci TaxID=166011 RepID=A0A915DIV0_9BILA
MLYKLGVLKFVEAARDGSTKAIAITDEVDHLATKSTKQGKKESEDDDYTDFNNKPIKNSMHSTASPHESSEFIPTLASKPTKPKIVKTTVIPTRPVGGYPLRKVGYYFQHYPYDKLPRFYQLNPHLHYIYPQQYEHARWDYSPQYNSGNNYYNPQLLGVYG